jgi:hypothetical protein
MTCLLTAGLNRLVALRSYPNDALPITSQIRAFFGFFTGDAGHRFGVVLLTVLDFPPRTP